MLSDHLRFNLIGIEVKTFRQMHPEAQVIEEGGGTQHAIMACAGAGDIGEWIGRIGHHQ